MASSFSSLSSTPYFAVRIRVQRRFCFNCLRFFYSIPRASCSNPYRCLVQKSTKRSFSFNLTRGFSDSHHLPPSSKLGAPSLQHFIAQASLTASESQPQ